MNEKNKQRIELHCHSVYSEKDGVSRIKDIIEFAAANNMPAVAITDHASVAGYGEAAYYGSHHDGLKVIYGIEAFVVNDLEPSVTGDKKYIIEAPSFHVTFLIKNEEGKQNLYELMSIAEERFKASKPRIPWSEIEKHREGLLIGSACEVAQMYRGGTIMDHVTRINLKTDCDDRRELIDFCLNGDKQFLVIGWSYIYEKGKEIKNFEDFYYAVKEDVSRINHAFNVFWDAAEGDLFWTRDLEGSYWICRVIDKAQTKYDYSMDIGAVLPVVAYKVGLQVPGQIKASFNRPRGGIAEGLYDDIIIEYSKHIYNVLSGTEKYEYKRLEGSILDNLPDFDLEELVIAYLQIVKNFYVLSNSIANKSTTIKIECELMSRDLLNKKKAVVQVKGGKTKSINAISYKPYADDGYEVYLYAPVIDNIDVVPNCYEITKESLLDFYKKYKDVLPESITRWEKLFD